MSEINPGLTREKKLGKNDTSLSFPISNPPMDFFIRTLLDAVAQRGIVNNPIVERVNRMGKGIKELTEKNADGLQIESVVDFIRKNIGPSFALKETGAYVDQNEFAKRIDDLCDFYESEFPDIKNFQDMLNLTKISIELYQFRKASAQSLTFEVFLSQYFSFVLSFKSYRQFHHDDQIINLILRLLQAVTISRKIRPAQRKPYVKAKDLVDKAIDALMPVMALNILKEPGQAAAVFDELCSVRTTLDRALTGVRGGRQYDYITGMFLCEVYEMLSTALEQVPPYKIVPLLPDLFEKPNESNRYRATPLRVMANISCVAGLGMREADLRRQVKIGMRKIPTSLRAFFIADLVNGKGLMLPMSLLQHE